MKRDSRSVPLRVRVTAAEAARYRAAMEKLGLDEMSTYVRWALANSTTQVLGVEGSKRVEAKPRPKLKPRQTVSTPAQVVPVKPQPQPSLTSLLGVPLFSPSPTDAGPRPLPQPVDDGEWV